MGQPIIKQTFFDSNCTGFVEFEESTQTVYLDPFYKKQGWFITSRDGNQDYDLILNIGDKNYTVEEKIRSCDYNDLTIEIIQDVNDKNMGWFFKTKAKLIFYIICKEKIPVKLFVISFKKLKEFIYKSKGQKYKLTISDKGYGESWNISVPWDELPEEVYKYFEINNG